MITFTVINNEIPICFNAGGDNVSFNINNGISNISDISTGITDAGKFVIRNSAGKIDNSNFDSIPKSVLEAELQVTLNSVNDKVDKSEIITPEACNAGDTIVVQVLDSDKIFTPESIESSKERLGINDKVEKINGKGLSANDFTEQYRIKLENIEPSPQPGYREEYLFNLGGV
jgi:hypothetical protein